MFLCIRALAQGQDSTIYAASSSGLACVQDGILTPVEDHPLLTGQTVYSLGVDAHGRIWAALNDWQCVVVDGTQVAGIVTSEMIFPDGQQIYAVTSDAEGRIYLGTYQNAVARVSFPGESLEAASFAADVFSTGDVTIHNALSVTEGGHMLICGQLGFAWLDPEGQLCQTAQHILPLDVALRPLQSDLPLHTGGSQQPYPILPTHGLRSRLWIKTPQPRSGKPPLFRGYIRIHQITSKKKSGSCPSPLFEICRKLPQAVQQIKKLLRFFQKRQKNTPPRQSNRPEEEICIQYTHHPQAPPFLMNE